jgi:hypothetical protein
VNNTIPRPKKDEVAVFQSFVKIGLQFSLHKLDGCGSAEEVRYIPLSADPNALVRLGVFIWAVRS